MKFGLGLTVAKSNSNTKGIDPTTIASKLIGWWDFTDRRTMYTDAGSTYALKADDKIYRIDNKAYTKQGNDTTALGKYLEQGTESKRPLVKERGNNQMYYAAFDGSAAQILAGTKVLGNVATNQFSASTLNGQAMSIIYVVKDNAASVSADEYLIHTCGSAVNDRMSVYVDNSTNDRWQWHDQNDSARTNTLANCGVNLTSNLEFWHLLLKTSGSTEFYRNGDSTDGITNGFSDNHQIDLSVNNNNVFFGIGGKTSAEYYTGNVYEIIIYDKSLTAAELRLLNEYLKKKYRT